MRQLRMPQGYIISFPEVKSCDTHFGKSWLYIGVGLLRCSSGRLWAMREASGGLTGNCTDPTFPFWIILIKMSAGESLTRTALMSKIMSQAARILKFLCNPFYRDVKFFFVIFILMASPELLLFVTNLLGMPPVFHRSFITWIKLSFDMALQSYVVVLIYAIICHFSQRGAKLYIWAMIAVCATISFADFACLNSFNDNFNKNYVALMKATNPSEATEFLKFYFPAQVLVKTGVSLLLCILLTVGSVGLINLIKRKATPGSEAAIIVSLSLFTLCSIGYTVYIGKYCEYPLSDLHRKQELVEAYFYKQPKLENPIPDLKIIRSSKPKNIIFIIGESLTPSHCSIYGYAKSTTPRMARLVRDSSMVVFSKAKTPWFTTNKAFSYFMTTASPENEEERPYYKSVTIPGLAKQAGYHTAWFSTQNDSGVAGDVISDFAHLCDTLWFSDKLVFLELMRSSPEIRASYDGAIVKTVENYIQERKDGNFMFVHLMGNHEEFVHRYPPEFTKFKVSDYPELDEFQKEKISQYDNSVYYNDSVVGAIIDLFRDREAIIIYFSDHALDLFVSNSRHCGHATGNNPESVKAATPIPFVVYMSPEFRRNHQDVEKQIRASSQSDFNTADIIYTITNIMGVELQE